MPVKIPPKLVAAALLIVKVESVPPVFVIVLVPPALLEEIEPTVASKVFRSKVTLFASGNPSVSVDPERNAVALPNWSVPSASTVPATVFTPESVSTPVPFLNNPVPAIAELIVASAFVVIVEAPDSVSVPAPPIE